MKTAREPGEGWGGRAPGLRFPPGVVRGGAGARVAGPGWLPGEWTPAVANACVLNAFVLNLFVTNMFVTVKW
ncbi:hypothetical protein FE156_05070 [Streptomyces albidoflavus]|nr:hypothetical protein FE156_05070 [Streptomyces albidoflavus]